LPAPGPYVAFVRDEERPLAPTHDLGVDIHCVPVFGTVPANSVAFVIRGDLRGTARSGEVDQIYMLVPRSDVLKLHPCGPAELNRILDVLAPLPHQFGLHAGLLEDLAHRSVVGEFVSFDMPAWRDPHPKLAVEVQKYFPFPYHEDRHREMPACSLRTHSVAGYTRQGYTGSQTNSTNLHNV
jgi:hypothetical protein